MTKFFSNSLSDPDPVMYVSATASPEFIRLAAIASASNEVGCFAPICAGNDEENTFVLPTGFQQQLILLLILLLGR